MDFEKKKSNNWWKYLLVLVIILFLFFWVRSFFGTSKVTKNSTDPGLDDQRYGVVSDLVNLPDSDDSLSVGSQSGATYPGNSLAVTNLGNTSSTTPVVTNGAVSCTDFVYNDWTPCLNSVQTRSIKSSSPAGCVGGNPVYAQNCGLTVVNTNICNYFTYSNWGSCINNNQTRTVTGSLPANCTGGNPVLSQSCSSTNKSCTAFTYGAWSACSNGLKTRSIVSRTPSGCTGGSPIISEVCGTVSSSTCSSFTYSEWGACTNGTKTRTVISSTPSGCTGGVQTTSQACVAATSTLPFYKSFPDFNVTGDKVVELGALVDISALSFEWGDDFASCAGTVKISTDQTTWNNVLEEADVTTPSEHSLNNSGQGRFIMFSKTDSDCSTYYVKGLLVKGTNILALTSGSTTATTTGN